MASGLKTVLFAAAAVAAVFVVPHILAATAAGSALGALPLVGHALTAAATWMGGHTLMAGIATKAATWGIPALLGMKAWGSHKENQAIAAEEAGASDIAYSSGLSRQQERALAIAQMQGDDGGVQSSRWADTIAAQRAMSQNVR